LISIFKEGKMDGQSASKESQEEKTGQDAACKKVAEKKVTVWCVCLEKRSLRMGIKDDSWNGDPGRICVYNFFCDRLEGPNFYPQEDVFELNEVVSAANHLLSRVRMP
jgi:hypothetical protein